MKLLLPTCISSWLWKGKTASWKHEKNSAAVAPHWYMHVQTMQTFHQKSSKGMYNYNWIAALFINFLHLLAITLVKQNFVLVTFGIWNVRGANAKFENPGKKNNYVTVYLPALVGPNREKTVPEVLSMTRSRTHCVECTNICKWPAQLAGQL